MSKKVREDIGNKRGVTDNHPFQSEGQTTDKVRFCLVVAWAKGTIRKPHSVERRERRAGIHMAEIFSIFKDIQHQ